MKTAENQYVFLCMRKADWELNNFIIGRIYKLVKSENLLTEVFHMAFATHVDPSYKEEILVPQFVH